MNGLVLSLLLACGPFFPISYRRSMAIATIRCMITSAPSSP